MEKVSKLITTASEYYDICLATCGYWIEMAEDIEVNHTFEKLGKHALVLLKLLLLK